MQLFPKNREPALAATGAAPVFLGSLGVWVRRYLRRGKGRRQLRGRGPSHRDQNPFGWKGGVEGNGRLPAAALNGSYFRLGSRSPSARSTQQIGGQGEEAREGEGNGGCCRTGLKKTNQKRLSNKFGQSLFIVYTVKKNKAFKLKFSAKAFVMS